MAARKRRRSSAITLENTQGAINAQTETQNHYLNRRTTLIGTVIAGAFVLIAAFISKPLTSLPSSSPSQMALSLPTPATQPITTPPELAKPLAKNNKPLVTQKTLANGVEKNLCS